MGSKQRKQKPKRPGNKHVSTAAHKDSPIFSQEEKFPKKHTHISTKTFLHRSPSLSHQNPTLHLRENNNQSQHQGIYQNIDTKRLESIGASTKARTVAKALNTLR
ncbi:hypothetical protein GBA52_000276 [Prunus armeniaca]|nr:hypothetical protein GBA52_000276 [Prunus armeniaca]